jgi:lipid-A-disaccharide synthase
MQGSGMHVFISAGEPSGDLHGSNFARALQARVPTATISGFGGPRLVNAGQEQLFPLADHAVMGLWRVLAALPQFYSYFKLATKEFDTHRPDAVVLVDYPGFHWHLAKAAHQRGIPVYWFVPPQIWAWATHRVKRMRKWVDHVFCNLPFETEWYQSRGVKCSFIGHPYFDALAGQRLDEAFITQQRAQPGRTVALLPGSRTHEVHDNFPMMMRTAELMAKETPGLRFLVAGFKEKQTTWMQHHLEQHHPQLPVEIHLGRTPEIIHLGEVCLAVSGSVSLELLYATTPTVTLYKIGPLLYPLVMKFKHARFISLINLLADQEISPEFLTKQDESEAMAKQLTRWLQDEAERQAVRKAMAEVRAGVARTGACARAVDHLLDSLKTLKRAA